MNKSCGYTPIKAILNDAQSFLLERRHIGEKVEEGKRRWGNIVLLMERLAHPPAVGSPSREIDQERASQFRIGAVERQPGDESTISVRRRQGLKKFQIAGV